MPLCCAFIPSSQLHYESWDFRLCPACLCQRMWKGRTARVKTRREPRGRATLSTMANWNTALESFTARQLHPECFISRSLMRHHFATSEIHARLNDAPSRSGGRSNFLAQMRTFIHYLDLRRSPTNCCWVRAHLPAVARAREWHSRLTSQRSPHDN